MCQTLTEGTFTHDHKTPKKLLIQVTKVQDQLTRDLVTNKVISKISLIISKQVRIKWGQKSVQHHCKL